MEIINKLQTRFEQHNERHPALDWNDVEKRLTTKLLQTLQWMEETGGEPDVVLYDEEQDTYVFMDCSPQTPERRSLCYDRKAWEMRKKNKPISDTQTEATQHGVQLLTEEEYRYLQTLGEFDTKTSSWIQTPASIRELGGALFGDRRYNTVFIYHNGADSYYAARGFRAKLFVK